MTNYHKIRQLLTWRIWLFFVTLTYALVSTAYDPFAETKVKMYASVGLLVDEIVTNDAVDSNGRITSTTMTLQGTILCIIGYNADEIPITMIVYDQGIIQSSTSYDPSTQASAIFLHNETGITTNKYTTVYDPIKNRSTRQIYDDTGVLADSVVLIYDENYAIARSVPAPTEPIIVPALAYNVFNQVLEALDASIQPAAAIGFVQTQKIPDPTKGVVNVATFLIGVLVSVTSFTIDGNIPVATMVYKHGKVQGAGTYNPITLDGKFYAYDDKENVQLVYSTAYDAALHTSQMAVTNTKGEIISFASTTFDVDGNPILPTG